MPKVKDCKNGYFKFYCHGCKMEHLILSNGTNRGWTFNGDADKPTFAPSFLVIDPKPRCHLFIRNGHLQYLGDCDHDLKNKTIEMATYPVEN